MAKRCLGCMKMKNQSPVCEHCGFNENIPNFPHQLPLNTLLRGQYRVGKVLGQGGFGITYMGWDTSLEAPVAIKEYFPTSVVSRENSISLSLSCIGDNAQDSFRQNRDRFLREARVLAKLHDVPGIVRVHNLFQENDTAYIIMEYVEGIDLKRFIRQQNRLFTVPEILSIMRPVMEALSTVHEAGLVHRDISPDNIMIQSNGKAKLLDFGAAREVSQTQAGQDMPQSTEAILKHGFAPIEQYRRRGSLGPWTDIYALCATMYYCLTGKVPADAPERIMGDDNVNWHQVSGLTTEQIAALERGMAVLPEQRFPSIQALYSALFALPQQNQTSYSQYTSEQVTGTRPISQVDFRNAYSTVQPIPVSQAPVQTKIPMAEEATTSASSVSFPTPAAEKSSQQVPLPREISSYSKTLPLTTQEETYPTPDPAPVKHTVFPASPTDTAPKEPQKKAPGKKPPVILLILGIVACLAVLFFTVHFWKDATCMDPQTCALCGKTRGESLGHSWQEATCTEPETCALCAETRGDPNGHNWQEATCTKGKICTVCREGGGLPLDHDWAPASYTAPKTCRRCGITNGSIKGFLGTPSSYTTDETFWRSHSSSYVNKITSRVTNCYKFILEYEIVEINSGYPYGNYELFGRDGEDGEWFSLGVFKMTEDKQSIPFEFEDPVTFQYISVICQVGGNCDIITSVEVTDIYTYVD